MTTYNWFQKLCALFGVFVYRERWDVEYRNMERSRDDFAMRLEFEAQQREEVARKCQTCFFDAAELRTNIADREQRLQTLVDDIADFKTTISVLSSQLEAERRSNIALRGVITRIKGKGK